MSDMFAEKCFFVKDIPSILGSLKTKVKKHAFVVSLTTADVKEQLRRVPSGGGNQSRDKDAMVICTNASQAQEAAQEPERDFYKLVRTFEQNNDYISAAKIALTQKMLLPFAKLLDPALKRRVLPIVRNLAVEVRVLTPRYLHMRQDKNAYADYGRSVTKMATNAKGRESNLGYVVPTPYEQRYEFKNKNNNAEHGRSQNENTNNLGVFYQCVKGLRNRESCELTIRFPDNADEDRFLAYSLTVVARKLDDGRVDIEIKTVPKSKRLFRLHLEDSPREVTINVDAWKRVFESLSN